VIDGDTIVVSGIGKVRLIGVDTPETVHPSKPVEHFGKEASAFTAKLLAGKKVRLSYDFQKVDRYNRSLVYVYLEDGTFVNSEIIKNGYGHAYTSFPFKYLEDFRKYEREAREASRGLWAPEEKSEAGVSLQENDRAPPVATDNISSLDENLTVYFTATGKKYHRENCRHLKSSKFESTVGKSKSRGLEPCKVCRPTQ
jgi:micrococcal nuclease